MEQSQESTQAEVVVGDSVEELTRRRIIEIGEPPGKDRLAVKTVVAKVKPNVVKAKSKSFWCFC